MTDRKCASCQADILYSDGHTCSKCKRNTMGIEERLASYNTRSAPSLPDGYREDAPVGFSNRLQYHHKSEVAGEFWITIAVWLYEEDKISIMKPLNPKHAHALAIWLQRGAR